MPQNPTKAKKKPINTKKEGKSRPGSLKGDIDELLEYDTLSHDSHTNLINKLGG